MKLLLYCLIPTIFVSNFRTVLGDMGKAGRIVEIIPELIAVLLLLMIIFQVVKYKYVAIAPKYWIIFILFVMHMLVGILLNSVSGAAIISGFRIYFKYLPLFLLPAVIAFSEIEIKTFFKLVMAFAFFQIPVAIYQQVFIFPNITTGDVIRGTMSSGAIMSIFLISTIGMLLAFYLRQRLKKVHFIFMILLLFFPTTINETKGTVILLPFVIAAVTFFHTSGAKRLKYMLGTLGVTVMLLAMFLFGYNYMFPKEQDNGLIEFFTEGGAYNNVYKQKEIGEGAGVGRVDSIVLAFNELSPDITKLAVGLGIGNLSSLGISEHIGGEYADQYAEYGAGVTTLTYLLWEIGLIGVVLFIILLIMIFNDALHLRHNQGIQGVVALGWLGVIIVVLLSLTYKNLLPHNVLGYLFLFISGYIASSRLHIGNFNRVNQNM